MKIVLDASVALSWLLSREDRVEAEISRKAAQAVVNNGALVPPIFFTETANGLLLAERSGKTTPDQANRYLADLDALPIETDREPADSLQRSVFNLARATSLTAYDAAYLELTLRTGSVLATFDQRLANAARSMSVALFSHP